MGQDLLGEPPWAVVYSPPMELGWALFFGSSLATAMLCPAATGDTCTSAGTLPPGHAGSSGGQPWLVYHVQDDIVVHTLSHDRCPTTGSWICPGGTLELHWPAACPSILPCASSTGHGEARTTWLGSRD